MSHSIRKPRRNLIVAGLTVAVCVLSGCAAEDAALLEDQNRAPYNATEAFPISVVKGPQTLELASGSGSLSPEQISAVSAFLHQAKTAGVTPVTLERPSGGGNSVRIASEVAGLMMQQGLARNEVAFRTYSGKANAPVRISYVSTYAATKPCGDWSEDFTDSGNNTVYANNGCAVHSNIAAMLANPKTAIAPRPVTAIPGGRAAAAVGKVTSPSSGSGGGFSLF